MSLNCRGQSRSVDDINSRRGLIDHRVWMNSMTSSLHPGGTARGLEAGIREEELRADGAEEAGASDLAPNGDGGGGLERGLDTYASGALTVAKDSACIPFRVICG